MTFISKLLCGMVFFSMMTIECMSSVKSVSPEDLKGQIDAFSISVSASVLPNQKVKSDFNALKEKDQALESFELSDMIIVPQNKKNTVYTIQMATITDKFCIRVVTIKDIESAKNNMVKGLILDNERPVLMFKSEDHLKFVKTLVPNFDNEWKNFVDLQKKYNAALKSLHDDSGSIIIFEKIFEDINEYRQSFFSPSELSSLVNVKNAKEISPQSNYKFTQNSLFLIAIVCSLYGLFGCMRPELVDIKHIQCGGVGNATVFFIAMLIDFWRKKE